ncbi:MAG: aminoacyl-tRNA hydrolase [Eubacteriales bacterium]|nr:aminoacyl-tRNA hydrolase [Eubacteriales bacterium]
MAGIFDLFDRISSKKANIGNIEYIVAGLGNPGDEYKGTRHNAGFISLDLIAKKHTAEVKTKKFNALVGEACISGKRVLLMKPQTYMNLSGDAISAAAGFYKIKPENIIVICDDINFDVGFMRIRRKGSAGGHNGLKDIIAKLGSDNFIRIKVGVGKKPSLEYDLASWVLGRFPESDRKKLDETAGNVCLAVEDILSSDIDGAMNKYSK